MLLSRNNTIIFLNIKPDRH